MFLVPTRAVAGTSGHRGRRDCDTQRASLLSLVGMRASLLLSLVGIASAYRLEVPFWTDDAGYCEPLPGLGAGVHRPTGLANISGMNILNTTSNNGISGSFGKMAGGQ